MILERTYIAVRHAAGMVHCSLTISASHDRQPRDKEVRKGRRRKDRLVQDEPRLSLSGASLAHPDVPPAGTGSARQR